MGVRDRKRETDKDIERQSLRQTDTHTHLTKIMECRLSVTFVGLVTRPDIYQWIRRLAIFYITE